MQWALFSPSTAEAEAPRPQIGICLEAQPSATGGCHKSPAQLLLRLAPGSLEQSMHKLTEAKH